MVIKGLHNDYKRVTQGLHNSYTTLLTSCLRLSLTTDAPSSVSLLTIRQSILGSTIVGPNASDIGTICNQSGVMGFEGVVYL